MEELFRPAVPHSNNKIKVFKKNHIKEKQTNNYPYLTQERVIRGLSIDSLNEMLLKTILPHCNSYYYPNLNQLKITKALTLSNPKAEYFAQLGKLFDQVEKSEDAIFNFEQALLKKPEDPKALYQIYKNLGNAYLKIGDYESAEENYNKAYSIHPYSSVININLGTLAIQKFEWNKVQSHFRDAIRINQIEDKAWVGLAIYHHYINDFDLALANLNRALDINPTNRVALILYLSWSPDTENRHQKLVRITKYLEMNQEDEEVSILLIHKAKSWGYFQLAQLEAFKLMLFHPQNITYESIYFSLREDEI